MIKGEEIVQTVQCLVKVFLQGRFLDEPDICYQRMIGEGSAQGALKKPGRHGGEDVKSDRGIDFVKGSHDACRPGCMAKTVW